MAAAVAATGFAFAAPAAFAVTTFEAVDFNYDCKVDTNLQPDYSTSVTVEVTAPDEVEPGAEVPLSVMVTQHEGPTAPDIPGIAEGLDAEAVNSTLTLKLEGDGATTDSVEVTSTNPEAIEAGEPVLLPPHTGAFTAGESGSVDIRPAGQIVIVQDQPFVGDVTTTCTPTTTPDVAATVTIAGDEPDPSPSPSDEPGDEGTVTTPGTVEWSGTYKCTSSNTDLQPDFESPATVTVSTDGTEFGVGQEIGVTGEFLMETTPQSPIELQPGAVQGTLNIGLSGDAAPTDSLALTTMNTEPLPANENIVLPPAEGSFTAEQAGSVDFSVGTLEMSILGGVVTVECTPSGGDDGGDPDPSPSPTGDDGDDKPTPSPSDGGTPPGDGGDDGNGDDGDNGDGDLPVTGAALGGLIAAAVAAMGGGGAALYLTRKRRATAQASSVDDAEGTEES